MKKKIYKFILMITMMILPVSVYALTGGISISCTPTEIKAGGEVTCSINGTSSSSGITQFEFNLSLDDKLSFKDQREAGDDDPKYFILKNNWQGDIANGRVSGYRDNPTSEIFKIGEFKVIVSASASAGNKTITISNAKYSLDEIEIVDVEGTSTTITVIEDEPTPVKTPELSGLNVTSGGGLNQTFSSDNTSYIVTLESATTTKFKLNASADDDFTVSAKNTDSNASIDLSKDISFEPAEDSETMSITVTVSYEDNSKDYVILVTRPKPSTVGSPLLASLIIGGETVNLKSGQFDYTIYLSSSTLNSYNIKATLEDADNFKLDDFANFDTSFSGELELAITVLPKDSNSGYGSKTYVINIVNKDNGNNSTTPVSKPSDEGNVGTNPGTGGSAIAMGIMLVVSFALSIYYYKRNVNGYN